MSQEAPSVISPGAFVGRERELAALRRVLKAAASGDGGSVLISGEAGMGKTRLAEILAAEAGDSDIRVLRGTGWQGGGSPPFWPWLNIANGAREGLGARAIAEELGPLAPELDRLDSEALTPPKQEIEGSDPGQVRFRLFRSVAELLRALSSRQPLLLVIDDLHWADTSSLLLFRFLQADVIGERILLAGTLREETLGVASGELDDPSGLARKAEVVTLTGLTLTETRDLVVSETGVTPVDRALTRLHELTGGNPLFVKETVRSLAVLGRLEKLRDEKTINLTMPPTVRAAALERLEQLTSGCRDLLMTASVAGPLFRSDLLRHAVPHTTVEMTRLLDEAEKAGIIALAKGDHTYSFTHDLVRTALYDEIPRSIRAEMHLRHAVAIEELCGTDLSSWLEQLADHYAHARRRGSIERARNYADLAGKRALEMLAYERAVTHFELALEFSPSDDDVGRAETLLALGDARMRSGDRQGATDAYREVAALARGQQSPRLLARAALGLGAGLGGFEVQMFDDRQIELLREALDALADEDSELKAWVMARLSVALSFISSSENRLALAEEAIQVARRSAAPRALAYCLAAHCDAIAGPAEVEERARQANEITQIARAAGDRELELLGLRLLFVANLERGDVIEAERTVTVFERVAEEVQQALYSWFPHLWRGMFALMDGRLEECSAHMETASVMGRSAGSSNAEVLVESQRINWLVESGSSAEACVVIDRYRPAQFPSALGWAVGIYAHAGRLAEARAHLRRLIGEGLAELPVDAEWLGSVCIAAEGCGKLGDAHAADELYRVLAPHRHRFVVDGIGAACHGSVERFLGVLAGVLGEWQSVDEHFLAALEANRRAGGTLVVAHTLRQHAEALSRAPERQLSERSRKLSEEAIEIYRALSLTHHLPSQDQERRSPRGTSGSVFRRAGEHWTLEYEGVAVTVRNVKGLHDLARLISNPGVEMHALDLIAGPPGAVSETGTGPLIDPQARRAYKQRIGQIQQEMAESEGFADPIKVERLRAELEALQAQLSAAYGLTGRARSSGEPAEKARSAVTWRIRSAITKIEKVHPALGLHLRRSVRTGTFCSYSPEKPVDWNG